MYILLMLLQRDIISSLIDESADNLTVNSF
jgi:hypothetical protein